MDVRTYVLDLISSLPPTCLWLDVGECQLDHSDEVVPTPEEHYGKGEKDGYEEAEVDDKEVSWCYSLIGERVQEIGRNSISYIGVAHYSYHKIRQRTEDNSHKDCLGHS